MQESHRFPHPASYLEHPPVPGERESYFPQPKDRSFNRPRKESRHV